MKYLVKTEAKNNPAFDVFIALQSKYAEFDNIIDVIDYIFKCANFIDSYRVYEIKEIDKVFSEENSTFYIDGKSSQARFN